MNKSFNNWKRTYNNDLGCIIHTYPALVDASNINVTSIHLWSNPGCYFIGTQMKLLKFLNLLDAAGNLSITNIAVIIVLAKLIMTPAVSITEVGMLLITLSNYAMKRIHSKGSTGEASNAV